jgi:hypothetical protein
MRNTLNIVRFLSAPLLILALLACAANEPGFAAPAAAEHQANADVVFVKAEQGQNGRWRFAVSVSHPDTGWDDYADGWDVVDANGLVVKANGAKFTRLLAHPHVGQVPFTRAQGGLDLTTDTVTVRAHDMVDGWGGKEIVVDLSRKSGPGYSVKRF